jgi:hypothetical protein
MDAVSKPAFVAGYTRILAQTWSSAEYSERLESDPRVVLAESGLATPADAQIEIIRSGDADPHLDVQIALWNAGSVTGRYVLHVPYLAQIDLTQISDEELGDLAGGVAGSVAARADIQP